MWVDIGIFALSAVQCYLFTLVAMLAARRLRLLDWPYKERKLHRRATPLMGGVAVILTLIVGVCEAQQLGQLGVANDGVSAQFPTRLLASAGLLCAIGLWDDKFGMRARSKFLLQSAAILPYVVWGRATTAVAVFGWQLDLAWLGIPLTLLWLVSCTNFVNLVDGLDGLATTVTLIVTLTVGVLSFLENQQTVFCLALVLSGALLGFLRHNWPPARIFLGDSGSLPLGFLAGALAIEASVKKAAGLTFAVPLVLLSVPMFDTSMAILRRKLNGMKIGQGDRAHIHHCLRDRGLTPTQTLLAIAGMCLATATAALLATIFHNDFLAVGICGVLLGLLIAGRVFGFNEVALLSRHVRAAWSFFATIPRALRTKFLLARFSPAQAEQQVVLWKHIVRQVQRMQGVSLEFTCVETATGRSLANLTWLASNPVLNEVPEWELSCAVPRGDGVLATVTAAGLVPPGGPGLRMTELLELFHAFCTHFPLDGQMRIPALNQYALDNTAHDARRPHILGGTWKELAFQAARNLPQGAIRSSDAA